MGNAVWVMVLAAKLTNLQHVERADEFRTSDRVIAKPRDVLQVRKPGWRTEALRKMRGNFCLK
jgi:hypothetical protein